MRGKPKLDRESWSSESSAGESPPRGASGSDSDSDGSFFITQKPVRSRRQKQSVAKSPKRKKGNGKGKSSTSKTKDKKKNIKRVKLPVYSFDLLQEEKPTNHVLNHHQNLDIHNALMGGFFCSVRELQAARQTKHQPSSLPTVDLEGDISPISEEEGTLEEEDIKVVNEDLVVLSKTTRPQPWYDPQRESQHSGAAAETPHKGLRGASPSSSRAGNSPARRQTCHKWSGIQAKTSKVKNNLFFHQEERQDGPASDSDATFCEFPEECEQSDDGASAAGAELQVEPEAGGRNEADGGDHESIEEESCHSHKEPEGLEQITSPVNVEDKTLNLQEERDVPDSQQEKKRKRVHEDVSEHMEDSSAALNSGVIDGAAHKKKKRRINDEDQERLKSDEVQNEDFQIEKKNMKESNDDGSGTCLETTEASEKASRERIKTRKKKKKHQLESEMKLGFSGDAVSVAGSQELTPEKTSFFESDGRTENTAEGAKDSGAQLVTRKKKKKRLSLSLCSDTVPQSDDSVQKTAEKKQTSSFPAADAETSASESAEFRKPDLVGKKKKKKKRMLEATRNDGKPSETLQMDEAERKRQKTPTGDLETADDDPTDEDGAVKKKKKKKKKKKDTGDVPTAANEHIQSAVDSCGSLTHEVDAKTGCDASLATDVKRKKKKKKNEEFTKVPSFNGETGTDEKERPEVTADFSDSSQLFEKSSHSVIRRKKRKRKSKSGLPHTLLGADGGPD
ncbi:phoenix isoform X2 [Salarias fasciatus]|uniref:phoenix isoform X2 n=1 Tax=Salarias fasciatus TaxID=181472 RepID=UPI0011768DD6|nr:uncharacterized protein LOC115395168 isoform X2 [Salarias fasciatus]